MANLLINGQTYNGVNKVKIPNTNAGQEEFIQPTGALNISENGTFDVSAYASAIVNVAAAAGFPIYKGKHTVSNRNTQHAVTHNLNLNSYLYMYWLDDMDTFIADTTSTGNDIVFGIASFNPDLGLPCEDSDTTRTTFGTVRGYKQSTQTWSATGTVNATSTKDKMELNFTYGVASGTYSYIIIDLSNFAREVTT